jgi:hypothetical protein
MHFRTSMLTRLTCAATMVLLALSLGGPLSAAAQPAAEVAIQEVIQRGNTAQVEALAVRDAALLGGTAVGPYAEQLTRINQSLIDSDVSKIELVNLEWGPIMVNGTTASATTFETWRTSFGDGPTEFARDRNVYSLVLDNSGIWRITSNEHPDGRNRGTPRPPPDAPPPPQSDVQPRPGTSRNWSGYAARGGTFTSVSATWTIPTLALDGPFGADAAWVGIGGLRTTDLIQAGTQQSVSGSGRVTYQAWVETLPDVSHPVPLTVLPGDSVTISVDRQGGESWLVSFANLTSGETLQRSLVYTSSLSSAEWIEEAPFANKRILPISHFGSLTFTTASAVRNGQSLTIADLDARAISLTNSSGHLLAVPSPLSPDGAGFTVSQT